MTFDAGIFDPINIGDTVWNDLNQDGIQNILDIVILVNLILDD